ncbi:conserved hypothetical protein [Pyrenophora tritici-repentis Pt-1C-BFP]|uniref:3'-5' exonuclease domain-containing protein n=1 Tax=Pyrenophora tritici-repentis (strain Pt-1C-BFP) TaxID=426418 RepID=B2W8M6_PYRTR|nr:uncharacterized protein PTRG_06334 [Pyrenophora tritici-repentis Pt-1C-BFP]EDU49254.1 conserved hypothetical protein [Pyrenophora tritici-repentis Pt-1C-BFP]
MAAPQETPIAPRMAFISTTDDLADMLGTLADLPTSPPSLYIDLEGNSLSRAGTLSLLTLYLTNSNLDIEAAQSAPAGLGTAAAPVTLKTILESPTIPKVFFDVRNDSDALFAHYKVALSCIHDLQVMELATRPMTTGNSRQFLCSLSTCIRDNAPLSSTDLAAWTAIKEAGNALFDPKKGGSYSVFETRPLRTEVQDYCVQDVVYMPLLWDIFEHRIQKDRMDEAELAQMAEEYEKDKKKMGFWETMVKEAVVLRISVTWETWYRPNGVHKRKGCWTWGQIREARRRWALGFRHGLCD